MRSNSDSNTIFYAPSTKRGTLATYVRVNITDFKDTFNILKAIGFFLVGTDTPTPILYRNS